MKIALRADASESQGTGHVMRCLTLAEALTARGHSVALLGSIEGIPWLMEAVAQSGAHHLECASDSLDSDRIVALGFDGVVVDSYRIPSELITQLNTRVPCLAIIDGDSRGISASIYLDQNLGASMAEIHGAHKENWLGGSRYALIRDTVLAQRRTPPMVEFSGRPRIVAFMGGTDPGGVIVNVTRSILAEELDAELTLVCPDRWTAEVEAVVAGHHNVHVIEPTRHLPQVLGHADIVVSAAGTSAWDICTMARPAVLIAVVENQRHSLGHIVREGVALGIDATLNASERLDETGTLVASLVGSQVARQALVSRCLALFDGEGKVRVVDAIERKWSRQ